MQATPQIWFALLARSTTAPRPEAPSRATPDAAQPPDQQHAIGWWALQWTPRVALLEDAVVMEVGASLRLFGGLDRLTARVTQEAAELGIDQVSRAPTPDAAVALARAAVSDGLAGRLADQLDPLPLEVLSAAAEHVQTLHRTGCRRLGQLRALPRGAVSRRFGKGLLNALDLAYGLQSRAFAWLALPQTFAAHLELPGRVDVAEGLVFAARRLLAQMAGWLAARHAGVCAFTLRWKHDFHRSSEIPDWGELTIRTAAPTRDIHHFARLLSEHLARTTLGAGVDELVLVADEVEPLEEVSDTLLLDKARHGEPLAQLLERLSARLGPQNVGQLVARSDYRPEASQAFVPFDPQARAAAAALPDVPQPTWLLNEPLRLVVRDERPLYQGALRTVAGPYRVEGAWWERRGDGTAFVRRDYYVMHSEQGRLLWVFRDLDAPDDERSSWYLQGVFG